METCVYVVTERVYKRAYHAEPWHLDRIVKVCGDYHSAVTAIRDLILQDHKTLDRFVKDLTDYTKHDPDPDYMEEGYRIISYEKSNDHYFESKSYRFESYVVE